MSHCAEKPDFLTSSVKAKALRLALSPIEAMYKSQVSGLGISTPLLSIRRSNLSIPIAQPNEGVC